MDDSDRSRSAGCDQAIWHIEDALCAAIGDRLVEQPEFIPSPSEPTQREIPAYSVIVARCGVAKEHPCGLTIDDIHHADQGTGRKVALPMTAELIIEDQPKRIIRLKVFLEMLCGVNQKPASMRAAPVPGLMHLAFGAPKAGPRGCHREIAFIDQPRAAMADHRISANSLLSGDVRSLSIRTPLATSAEPLRARIGHSRA